MSVRLDVVSYKMGSCLGHVRNEICIVCLENVIETAIFPCGHHVLCLKCGSRLQTQEKIECINVKYVNCTYCFKPTILIKSFRTKPKKCRICTNPVNALLTCQHRPDICYSCLNDFLICEQENIVSFDIRCPLCCQEGKLIIL